jgi:ubiquinone/menaquinone biosynthesis C-methylase UbiE
MSTELSSTTSETFQARFYTEQQARRYRDRYLPGGRRARTNAREHAALRALLATIPRLSVAVDIPCGSGRMFPPLAERAESVILADASEAMLAVAREEPRGDKASYLLTTAERIELGDGSVDLVFCHRLIPHIYDAAVRRRMLCEFGRVSRRFAVISFHPPGLRRRIRWALRSLVGMARYADLLRSIAQLKREATECGFRLVQQATLRAFPKAAFLLFERSA